MILAWLSAAFVLGVVTGSKGLPLPPVLALALVLLGVALVVRHTGWRAPALVLAVFCLGAVRAPPSHFAHSPNDVAYYNGSQMQLQGLVSEEPDIRDTGANYVVTVSRITLAGHTRTVSGRVEVHTSRAVQLDYGDSVLLTGTMLTPTNSAAVPYQDILAQHGIHSLIRFPRVQDLGPVDTGWLGWIVPLRQRLEAGIDAWLPEPEAALLIAITLGAHSASLGNLAPVLVQTGLIHIIAISGIKVALVAGTLYQIVGLARRRALTLAASLFGLTLYVLLTGATPSGVRSGIMWALVFVASYLGRGTVALVSLSFAAAVMIAFDPSLPVDIGFLLSAIGTAAIISFTDPLENLFRLAPSPARFGRIGPVLAPVGFLLAPVGDAFCVTFSAQAGTLPIVVSGFHIVSASGPIANALVLPLLPVIILVGFVLGALSALSAIAAPAAALVYILLDATVAVSNRLAWLHAPLSFSPLDTALYYGASVIVASWLLHRAHWAPLSRWRGHWREISMALLVAVTAVTASIPFAQAESGARLRQLGSANGLLLQSGDMTALIDGSPKPLQYLEQLGAALPFTLRTIDLVVVTDPRASNVSGLDAMLAHYNILEVLDVGAQYPSTTYARWRADLRARGVPVYALRTGASAQVGSVTLTALGPDSLYGNPVDCIGLVRLTGPHRTILLAGSASKREQIEAEFRPIDLRANLLWMDGTRGILPSFVRRVLGARGNRLTNFQARPLDL